MKRLALSMAIPAMLSALFYAPNSSAQTPGDLLMLPPTVFGSSTACDDTTTNLQILTFNAYALNPGAPLLGPGVSSINCFSGLTVDPATGNIFTTGSSTAAGVPLNVTNLSSSATTVLALKSTNNSGAYVLFDDSTSTTGHPPIVGADGDNFNVQVAAIPATSTPTGWQGAIIAQPGGKVGIDTITPQATLDVNGEARIGNSGVGCSAANEGAMHYNFSSHTIEYCNGTSWTPIGNISKPFGGLYEQVTTKTGVFLSCLNPNPYTGGCSCPSGFFPHGSHWNNTSGANWQYNQYQCTNP